MKVVLPKENGFQKKSQLLLTLEEDPEEMHVLDKTNSIMWELSARPGAADAATYKYPCRVLALDWRRRHPSGAPLASRRPEGL